MSCETTLGKLTVFPELLAAMTIASARAMLQLRHHVYKPFYARVFVTEITVTTIRDAPCILMRLPCGVICRVCGSAV